MTRWVRALAAIVVLWALVVLAQGRRDPSQVEVTGINGAPVATTVENPVSLGESSTAAIRTPLTCTHAPTSRYSIPSDTLARALPLQPDGGVYPFGRWNHILTVNADDKDAIYCNEVPPDAGTYPTCTVPGWGAPLLPGGGFVDFENVTENQEVWCRACGGAATIAVTVGLCTP